MATTIFRPVGDYLAGAFFTPYPASPATHFDKVNEESADDDSSYIYNTGATPTGDLYSFTSPLIPATANINYVKVYARHKKVENKDCILFIRLYIQETWDATSPFYPTQDTWTTSSKTWTTNPKTSLPWTVDEVNGTATENNILAFGVRTYYGATGLTCAAYITQCYMEISYTVTEEVTVSDSLILTEVVETATDYHISITDALTLTDAVTAGAIYPVSISDSLSLTEALTIMTTYTATIADVLTLTDSLLTAQSLRTDHSYYLASSTGNIYTFGETQLSDAGMAISSFWKSKRIDFADQHPDIIDKWKTLYKITVHYEDLSASTLIILHVSTDGGANWTTSGKSVGTGAGTIKEKDFFFIKTGRMFNFKVESASTANYCKVIALEAEFDVGGEHFEV